MIARGQALAFWAIVLTCFGLLSLAVLRDGDMAAAYRRDLENNRHYCEAASKAEKSQDAKECQSVLFRTLDDPVALFTAALALVTTLLFVATFGLFVYASRQAREARAAVDLAGSTAERQLRAYVHVAMATGALPRGEGGVFTVSVEVRNFGQTPARDVRAWLAVWPAPYPDPGSFKPAPPGFGVQAVLAPGGHVTLAKETGPIAPWLAAFRAGTHAVYAYGRITYTDAFGNGRFTEYRLVCYGERVAARGGAFDLCREGNDSD